MIFSMTITGLASTSMVWQGCIFHHGLDRGPAFGSLIISCDRACSLMKEAWFEWGQRELAGGGSQRRLPVINPGAEVTPESAEFRLCPVPIVEASESFPAPAPRAPPFPAPAPSPQTSEGRKDLMFSHFSVPSSLFLFLLNLFSSLSQVPSFRK